MTIKKASLDATPGMVEFGMEVDMDTGSFSESVEVDLDSPV